MVSTDAPPLRPASPGRRPWWTAIAVLAAGIAAAQLGMRAALWFLPYHIAGLANEFVLVAAAGLAGLALYLARRRRDSPPPARLSVLAASLLYLVASSAGLGWSSQTGLALGAHEYALFSTPGCDFTARFQRPPAHGRLKGVLDAGGDSQTLLQIAVLSDIATATAFRAECLPLPPGSDPERVAQGLEARLGRWADDIGLNRRTSSLRNDPRGPVFSLDGEIRGSILPEQQGEASRTLVGLRSYVGPASLMTVYVLQPQGDVLSAEAAAFLENVQRRP